ncbi:MAG TPA: SDR family oxidoreductase [Acidimicrobiales bacterium]|nr:SDR family oxidoreductase [Acidimicrobiales bacterium]
MGLVLVTGGTGSLGSKLVPRLAADGHRVRILSRRPGGADVVQGDLRTGAGLEAAVDGVDVIAHCASSPFRHTKDTDVEGTRRLLQAVRAGGGRPHLVYVSIVGVDRIPFGYYQQKFATEQVIEAGDVPWTILRAVQFHELLDYAFSRMKGALIALRGVRFQLLAADECAARLASLVNGPASGRVPDMGGPEARSMIDLARVYRRTRGWRRPVLQLPAPGKAGRAFKAGDNLAPDHPDGTITWEQWLASRYG